MCPPGAAEGVRTISAEERETMGRKYREKNYRYAMKWSIIAILFITMIVPLSVGTAQYLQEQISKEQIRVHELNNETLGKNYPYLGATSVISFQCGIYDNDGPHYAELSPYWNANGTKDSVYIQTGATTTDNTSQKNRLYIIYNLSAKTIINNNIENIHIEFYGLTANTTASVTVEIAKYLFTTESEHEILLSEQRDVDENGTLKINIELDPAVISYCKDFGDSIIIRILSYDATKEIFKEGDVIYFDIYATKPKTTVIGQYSALELGIFFTGIITFFAAIAATGYFNPLGYKQVITSPLRGLSRYYRKKRGRRNFYRRRYRRWY